MKKRERRELLSMFFFLAFLLILFILSISFIIRAENSESSSSSEWKMYGKYLNHTSWDGVPFSAISGLSSATFTVGGMGPSSPPTIANGYLYIAGYQTNATFQLNASNISQQIANFTMASSSYSFPTVANGYVYTQSYNGKFFQLNASNISKQIANFTVPASIGIDSFPAVANGFVYIGFYGVGLYQLNESNISQQIANFSKVNYIDFSSPAVANGFVYIGAGDNNVYQLNASNVSQQIANYTTGNTIDSSPAVFNGSVYIGSSDAHLYQLNASNISQQIANFTVSNSSFSTGIDSSPAISNGYIYVGSYTGLLYQLDISNISTPFATYNLSPMDATLAYTSPVIAYGSVFIEAGHSLFQLNASNVSQKLSNFTTPTVMGGSYSPAVANGYVYFGSMNGNVYQINITNISTTSYVCISNWQCAAWLPCSGGSQTRLCEDWNSCNVSNLNKIESQSCSENTGGSGAGVTTTAGTQAVSEKVVISSIVSGGSASVNIDNSNIDIRSITLNAKNNITNASLNVSKVSTTQESNIAIQLPFGEIYQAFNIDTTVNNADLNNVTMEFRVEKSWLEQKNYTVNDISLYRIPKSSSLWQPLVTTSIREDSQYYYFLSLSPGFSTFVILLSEGTIKCSENQVRCFNDELQICTSDGLWGLKEDCQYGCTNAQCEQFPKVFGFLNNTIFSMFFYAVVVVIISGILIVLYFLIQNIKRENFTG